MDETIILSPPHSMVSKLPTWVCLLKTGHPTELLVQAPSVSWSAAGIKALHDSEINIMVHGKGGQGVAIKETDETGKGSLLPLKAELDAVDAFIACLRTDRPDGLYTTVVVDECNIALGLVYSAAQSIRVSPSSSLPACLRAYCSLLPSSSS